jgi:acyl-CoA synthetase (AMP-forming)/AMP-acid ligase II
VDPDGVPVLRPRAAGATLACVKLPRPAVPILGPKDGARVARAVWDSGLLGVVRHRPDHLARVLARARRFDLGPSIGAGIGAELYPDEPALVDDEGVLTFAELDRLCDAAGLRLGEAGLDPGDRVGLLARNSRGFYAVMVGAARAGIDVAYLNTGATPEQVADIVPAEGIAALACDADLADRVPADVPRLDLGSLLGAPLPPGRPDPRGRSSQHVILTSGTTGRPRGVARGSAGMDAATALVAGFPYRVRRTHLVAAPAFHAWGWMNLVLSMVFCSTVVLTRRFDPERVLELVERERADALVAVPVMLQRLVELDAGVRARYDTSSLRVVAVSGSALSGALAERFMDAFGDVVHNLYGSTEAAFATVAGPRDLREAPGTAGRPLPGVTVTIVGEDGEPLPDGETGEIVVRSGTAFHGYTSGDAGKVTEAGVRIGDLGRFTDGRLFVAGRVDDLVITGGENVYPVTVENELERHPDVVECAVVGEPDERFGQALVAYVTLREGAAADGGAIRDWLKARLGRHEVPRRVVVHDGPLPRNTTGKILKTRLRDTQDAGG